MSLICADLCSPCSTFLTSGSYPYTSRPASQSLTEGTKKAEKIARQLPLLETADEWNGGPYAAGRQTSAEHEALSPSAPQQSAEACQHSTETNAKV